MSEKRGQIVSLVLRERGRSAWAAAVGHPMVREIGEGTLPHETFRRYFEQNILYLGDYARAIGLIIGKAPDTEAIDVLARFLGQIAGTEIPANIAFLSRLGGSSAESPDPAAMLPTTYAYTRHLLYTSAQGTCAEGLAAVLPCQWSYGELAGPLMAALPADPVYADWISMFGSADYGALVEETTALLDRLADQRDGAAMPRLAHVFDLSTHYEVQFWDMAYGVPASHGRPPGKEPSRSCVLPESSRT
jgi:thiaminase/transcriptional activator TenA